MPSSSPERSRWTEISQACAADLLSDVLALVQDEGVLLVTGSMAPQVLRVAEVLGLSGLLFVRGKSPCEAMCTYARQAGLPLLVTELSMFEACGILYSDGGRIILLVADDRVELLFSDRGSGIPDIELARTPGYSTAPDWARELGFGAGLGGSTNCYRNEAPAGRSAHTQRAVGLRRLEHVTEPHCNRGPAGRTCSDRCR